MFWSSIILCAIFISNEVKDTAISSNSFLGASLYVFAILSVGLLFRFLSMRQPYQYAPVPVVKSKVFLYAGWLFYFFAGAYLCSFLAATALLLILVGIDNRHFAYVSAIATPYDFLTILAFAIDIMIGNFFYKRALNPPFWTLGTTITMLLQGFQRSHHNITPPSP